MAESLAEPTVSQLLSSEQIDLPFKCKHCAKEYKSRSGLFKHCKTHHASLKGKENEQCTDSNIVCDRCQATFGSLDLLISHQKMFHNIHSEMSYPTFSSINAFLDWKRSTELESNTLYVQQCSMQSSQKYRRWYYYCSRGGQYRPMSKGERKRNEKVQGSSKIGTYCTAYMKVVQDILSGEVSVDFCSSHNHSIALSHIPITEDSRMSIARQLQEGVAVDKILDNIRDNLEGSIKRHHLINKQDVNNIRRQFNIEGVQKHKDDQTSVCAWVTELKALEYNPITIFKPQGQEGGASISKEDFLLGIQTEFQADMMKAFGDKLICMDATHGTNHYDFKLITVLVLDDFGEGIPVGWLVSNKEDGNVLKEFLKSLLTRTGPIEPKYFMSDDAPQYFSSWNEIFGGQPSKLLCTWHVHKAWRSKIQTITSAEKRASVYCLCTILQSLKVAECRKLMQQAITWMLSDTTLETFCKYFQTNYARRIEQWAYCFRVGTPANTNMSVEAFHRLLKVVYLQSKHNRRIDQLLSVLLRIARDKVFERISKTEKGKCSHRMKVISQRHSSAVKMLKEADFIPIDQVEEVVWKVSSGSLTNEQYFVRLISKDCDCRLHCASCSVCPHMYTCSCVDSAVHSTACKHCHIVNMKTSIPSSSTKSTTLVSTAQINEVDKLSTFLKRNDTVDTERTVTIRFRELLSQLEEFVTDKSCNEAVLKAGMTHLTSAVGVMKSMTNKGNDAKELKRAKTIASSTNIQTQIRFHSTKKRKICNDSLSQPTAIEKQECRLNLTKLCDSVSVCAICFKEDSETLSDHIDWIQCTNCSIWLHMTCANVTDSSCSSYICSFCDSSS